MRTKLIPLRKFKADLEVCQLGNKMTVENSLDSENKNFCRCGCGTEIPFTDKRNRPVSFAKGHYVRLCPIPTRSNGKHHYRWKGGKIVNAQGYVMVLCHDHPRTDSNNRVREHILVMENHVGRFIARDEEIHHIDGNKQNNDIGNLKLMSKTDHRRHHMRARKNKEK